MQQHLYLSLPLTIAAPPSLSHRSASWLFLVRCKCENGRGKEEKGWKRSSARVFRRPGHQHPFLLQTNPSFFHLSFSFSFPTPGSISVASALFVSWPAISWNFRKGIKQGTRIAPSCGPCVCDCPLPHSLLNVAPGLVNLSISDCGKHDPDLNKEMEKQFVDLLTEELQ